MFEWVIRQLLTPRVMLFQQKGLCKQCQTRLEGKVNFLRPTNSLAVEARIYGVFCSEDCEIKYTVNRRQELEAKYQQRIPLISK